MSEEEYISIVGEIFDGYTEFEFKNRSVYLKHFSIRDQRYIHKYYEKYKNIAINKGIPTEQEMLEQLKKDGLWTLEDEDKIAALDLEISNLKETQRLMSLPSQKKSIQDSIDDRTAEVNVFKNRRKEVVGRTAEDFASVRANNEFIRYILFKDKSLTIHLFTDDEFDDLSDTELLGLTSQYELCNHRLNESNIQHAVLRDFFNMYLSQTENISDFYGKPIVSLSVFQLKLAIYARVFFNIFQYNEDIPEFIKKDPEAIFKFSDSKKNGQKLAKNYQSDSGGTAVFGAEKSDLEFVDPNAKQVSLSEEIAKKGGSMNMDDLIKLMGE